VKHPRFAHAEAEYARLKAAHESGALPHAEAEARMATLVIEHEGRHWCIGASSGQWYVWSGTEWTRAATPLASSGNARRGWIFGCFAGCLAPLLFVGGLALLAQSLLARTGRPDDLALTILLTGVVLFFLAVSVLMPRWGVIVLLVAAVLWAIAGFLTMHFELARGSGYVYWPDHVFAAGIAAIVGTILGALGRKIVR
jgi:hypothetical protein